MLSYLAAGCDAEEAALADEAPADARADAVVAAGLVALLGLALPHT